MNLRLFIPAFLFALLLYPCAGLADPASDARQTLEKAVTSIMDDIRSPAFANPDKKPDMIRKIENSVRSVFDFGEFSSRTVGPRWKTFSADEKKRFEDAFANLLFSTYLNKITGYSGESVQYLGETVSSAGNRVEVKTTISLSDGRKIPVAYRMLLKNGGWHVYDVIIESISLVKNYRTQFQDILNSATPDQLIAKVNDKAAEMMKQGNANAK